MGPARTTSGPTQVATQARGRGGRPLDNARDPVFRKVALELLAEVGYERLTMEAVASRAGAASPRCIADGPARRNSRSMRSTT